MSGWSAERLTLTYRGASAPALDEVSMAAPASSCTAVLGPNGSGKSTLLRILLGVLPPDSGTACFAGRDLREWPRAELARRVGAVPQGEENAFPITVREMVELGRYPHLGPWRRARASDVQAVEEAMHRCDVARLADRTVDRLSGGELQRTRLARALAQQPGALALDEPTAALDVGHEMVIWELLRELVALGTTVLVVTHNLNLAARYADRLILLSQGRVAAAGTPAEVVTREAVERVYGWPVRIAPHPGPGADAGAPQVVPLSASAPAWMGADHAA